MSYLEGLREIAEAEARDSSDEASIDFLATFDAVTVLGLITLAERTPDLGAWVVTGFDYHVKPVALFADELSARRYADQNSGVVAWWPWGEFSRATPTRPA